MAIRLIRTASFDVGMLLITRQALQSVNAEDVHKSVIRHLSGDWGDLCDDDWRANDSALRNGGRLLSSYVDRTGVRFWIITECDRSVTTILLPQDY